MPRDLTVDVKSALTDNSMMPVLLMQITVTDTSGDENVDTTIFLSDFSRNLTWDGDEYQASGQLLGITEINEGRELQIESLRVSLSGVDQAIISLLMNYDFIDRFITVFYGLLDVDSEQIIDDPFEIFRGRMNTFNGTEDKPENGVMVAVEATSHWVDFERRPGRHTNTNEQEFLFPGDLGMEFASASVVNIQWG